MILTASTFFGFTALVAVITYFKTRHDDHGSNTGYFLGGRSLSAIVIAGSLLLTNLSTEQIVGQSGNAYAGSLVIMAWETIAAIAMVVMAVFFLPRYLAQGITTVPGFLEKRYDRGTRIMVSFLLLAGTGIVFLPVVLYSGALALNGLFDVPAVLGLSKMKALCLTIAGIGIVGCLYAIYGGLKAVAVSDTINGVGLLTGGLLIPVLGIYVLGKHVLGDMTGDAGAFNTFIAGMSQIASEHPEKISSIGGPKSDVPFSTLFTGMFLVNCFYWCTNQGIVQRTFGAKNLATGQKGVLIAAFFKLFGPVILIVPGIIAFHMFGDSLETKDMAYPSVVAAVLPGWLKGFFGAVLFGAILSTYNSFLNSASTMFSLDIYKGLINKDADEAHTVRMGKHFGTGLAVVSILVAPFIFFAKEGLFTWMKQMNGFYNVPLLTIVLVGMFSKRVPAVAAKVAMVLGVALYALAKYVVNVDMHFLNVLGTLFVVNMIVMNVIGLIWPRKDVHVDEYTHDVDITPWRYANLVGAFVVMTTVAIYIFFAQFTPPEVKSYATVVLRNAMIGMIVVGAILFAVKKVTGNGQSAQESDSG